MWDKASFLQLHEWQVGVGGVIQSPRGTKAGRSHGERCQIRSVCKFCICIPCICVYITSSESWPLTFPSSPVRQAGGGAPEGGRKHTILGRMQVGKRGEDASVVAKLGTELATERGRDIGRGGSGFGGGGVGKEGLRQAPAPSAGLQPGTLV